MKLGWSPEQISIRLPLDYKEDTTMRISYEAVYEYVYKQIYRNGYMGISNQTRKIYVATYQEDINEEALKV